MVSWIVFFPVNNGCVCFLCVCRYWLFSDVVPGLYVEKGWVHESIDYNFTLPPEPIQEEEVEEDDETEGKGAISYQLWF